MGMRTVAVVNRSVDHCGMFTWHKKEAQKISVHSHICRCNGATKRTNHR